MSESKSVTGPLNRPSQAAVNLAELLVRLDNDHDLLCELVGIFKHEFPPLFRFLQQSVAHEDLGSVEVTSHALKGMLSALSATRAAAIAAQIEEMARKGKTPALADALKSFEREVAELLTELDGYIAEAEL